MADAVEWVEDETAFLALADAWDELAELDPYPFLRHSWFACWWQAFGGDRRLRICTVRRDGELAGVFPLCVRRGALEAMANIHSPVFTPLARDESALAAAVEAVFADRPGSLVVSALPSDDRALALLCDHSRAAGNITFVEHQYTSPIVQLDGDFERFKQSMDKDARKDIERRRRKLEREHEAAVQALAPPDNLDGELERGFEIEGSGWKGGRGTAILGSEETAVFYRSVSRAFAAAGRLRMSSVYAEGKMIAFDLNLVDHGRLWIPKGGFDEAFRSYAPGLVLTLAQIEAAAADRLEGVELLGDVAEWKLKFSNAERRHCIFQSYRRAAPVPLARYAWRRALRPALKSARDRVSPRASRRG
jgi:CelD/BcsL family acetyltransferase involved in cellulose biosynthesis